MTAALGEVGGGLHQCFAHSHAQQASMYTDREGDKHLLYTAVMQPGHTCAPRAVTSNTQWPVTAGFEDLIVGFVSSL